MQVSAKAGFDPTNRPAVLSATLRTDSACRDGRAPARNALDRVQATKSPPKISGAIMRERRLWPILLSILECARALGIDRHEVYDAIASGALPLYRRGTKRRVLTADVVTGFGAPGELAELVTLPALVPGGDPQPKEHRVWLGSAARCLHRQSGRHVSRPWISVQW